MVKIIGWDIGGVNSKAALIDHANDKIISKKLSSKYFPIFKHKREEFFEKLLEISDELSLENVKFMAVTITAELSDAFFSKREGLEFITKCFHDCFPDKEIYFLTNERNFLRYEELKDKILKLAATNWIASSFFIGKQVQDCLFIDIGSTTTDIIPIINGKHATTGVSDLDRLISGELVYTGTLRSTIPSILHYLNVKGKKSRISFEKFALIADVHLVLHNITSKEYTCETADDRPNDYNNSLARISRIVCADTEMLTENEILQLAQQIHDAQVEMIKEGIQQVTKRIGQLDNKKYPIVVLGLGGKILAEKAAKDLGFNNIIRLSEMIGEESSNIAPSLSVAYMLANNLR